MSIKCGSQRTKSDEQFISSIRDVGLFLVASASDMEIPINPDKSRGLQLAAGRIQSNWVVGATSQIGRYVQRLQKETKGELKWGANSTSEQAGVLDADDNTPWPDFNLEATMADELNRAVSTR
jgi:hypothetical protein